MEIFNSLHEAVNTSTDLPQRFISPAPTHAEMPKDGVLEFRTVEKLADLLATVEPRMVTMFRADQEDLLKCLVEYFELFGYAPVVMTGIPDIAYSPEFDGIVWELPKAAYHATVNDLIEYARRQTEAEAEKEATSIITREKKQFTRKDGSVKEFTGYELTSLKGAPTPEPDDAAEE